MPPSKRCTKIVNLIYGTFEKKGSGFASQVDFDDICAKFGCLKKDFDKEVVITVERSFKISPQLPSCGEEFQSSLTLATRVKGYFKQRIWKSLTCSNSYPLSPSISQSCLQNKLVFFLGDSTVRQFFFEFAVNVLHLPVIGENKDVSWHYPKIAHSALRLGRNISLYYRAHGPPLFNVGPPHTKPYISDSIVDLPVGGKDVYVVLNIGVHFLHFHPNYYLNRLKGIKSAILKHQERFPETNFIVRGLNVIESSKEWCVYRLEVLLRSIFTGMKNVVYLDLWDLTTIWILKLYHPEETVLRQEAAHMLSYICGKK